MWRAPAQGRGVRAPASNEANAIASYANRSLPAEIVADDPPRLARAAVAFVLRDVEETTMQRGQRPRGLRREESHPLADDQSFWRQFELPEQSVLTQAEHAAARPQEARPKKTLQASLLLETRVV